MNIDQVTPDLVSGPVYAKHLGISYQFFRDLVARGQGPACITLGSRKLYRIAGLDAFINEHVAR